jgi:hypothetical protein
MSRSKDYVLAESASHGQLQIGRLRGVAYVYCVVRKLEENKLTTRAATHLLLSAGPRRGLISERLR